MSKILAGFLCFALMIFNLPLALAQAPSAESPQSDQHQAERKAQEGVNQQVRLLAGTPWLWEHPGTDPYIEGGAKTREELVTKIIAKASFIKDLMEIGLTRPAAEYVREQLIGATKPDSKVSEIRLLPGDFIERMKFGSGTVRLVQVATELPDYGGDGNAYQVLIPEELGAIALIIPKICVNVGRNPHPASVMTLNIPTPSAPGSGITTDLRKEIERIVDERVKQSPNILINNRVSTGGCGKTCKILIIVGLAVGGGLGGFAATRGKQNGVNPIKIGTTVISPQ